MLKNPQATAGDVLQHSQNCVASFLRTGSFGGGHASGEMRLRGRVSRAESAPLLRFRAAHRAPHRHNLSQRQLFGLHTNIIQQREYERWSKLLSGVFSWPGIGILPERDESPLIISGRSALHGGDISRVYACFFRLQKAAQDFS
jgi:hypothetical protein